MLYLNTRTPAQWLRLWRKLRAKQFDLLYVNSFWEPTFTIAPIIAMRLGFLRATRILIAPRGELSPGALSLTKSKKKRMFLKLWRPLLGTTGVLWHASGDQEAADIMALFPQARVEIGQDQVLLPHEPIPATQANEGRARFVFVGRISAKKNLDLALAALRHMSSPVDFDIYGPVEDRRYWSKCRALMRQAPPAVRVRYMGELTPMRVRMAFAQSDAFVFPTRGENFGHAIAESLSASCPVICSTTTRGPRC